jgi:hypothetical protein
VLRWLIAGLLLTFVVGVYVEGREVKVRKTVRRKVVSYEGARVREVIVRHSPEVQTCYARVSKKHPGLYGTVVLHWEIGKGGKVGKVWISEPLRSELDHCIADRLRGWKFPEPPGGAVARVSFPFSFNEVAAAPDGRDGKMSARSSSKVQKRTIKRVPARKSSPKKPDGT